MIERIRRLLVKPRTPITGDKLWFQGKEWIWVKTWGTRTKWWRRIEGSELREWVTGLTADLVWRADYGLWTIRHREGPMPPAPKRR